MSTFPFNITNPGIFIDGLLTSAEREYVTDLVLASAGASEDDVLTWKSGAPSWEAPTGGFSDPLTTNGDIIARVGGVTTRLPQGSNGTFLGVSGGVLGYYAASSYTDEQAQDAIGAMLANSTFINLAYNDATPSLVASLSATGTPSASTFLRGDNTWATPSGSGDVVGPASSVTGRIATFNGTTGKLIQDGGSTIADVLNRANHTGSQAISTITNLQTTLDGKAAVSHTHTASQITDFDTEVSNNTDVAANTAARHNAVTLAGALDYITLAGQVITRNPIDLTTDVTGDLPFANLAQLSAHQVLGRAGTGVGDVAGITMGNDTILGRSGSGNIDALSAATVRTILSVETTSQLDSRDTANRSRSNHTGTQLAATISDFAEAVDDEVSSLLVAGSNITLTYNDIANTLTIASSGGGSGNTFNDYYIDQTPDNGTYGLLGGSVNGTNTVFTVSQGEYATGTLEVYLNGQLLTQGGSNDWTETTPASGTFTFVTAPLAGDVVTARYATQVTNSSTVIVAGDLITSLDATAHRLFYSDGSGNITELAFGASGTYLKSNGTTSAPSFDTPAGGGGGDDVISVVFDGQGSTPTVGSKAYYHAPYGATITGWTIYGFDDNDTPVTGSAVVDVWKETYANYPATVADTIAGSEKPTLSSASKNQDVALSSWTTTITSGDHIVFNLDSVTTCTKVRVFLHITKT